MQLKDYIINLFSGIKKTDILDDLQKVEQSLNDVVLPSTTMFLGVSKNPAFKTKDIDRLVNIIRRTHKGFSGDSVSEMLKVFKNNLQDCSFIVPTLTNVVVDEFPDIINKNTSSIRDAAVLRSIEHLLFIAKFTVTLYDYMLDKALIEKTLLTSKVSKREEDYIIQTLPVYIRLLQAYVGLSKDYLKEIKKVPDIVIDPNDKNLITIDIKSKSRLIKETDNVSGFIGSPFYRIGMMYAELKAAYYEIMKSRKQQLELKIMYLEEDTPSPAVEKQLKYYREQVSKTEYRIGKMEENVGLSND